VYAMSGTMEGTLGIRDLSKVDARDYTEFETAYEKGKPTMVFCESSAEASAMAAKYEGVSLSIFSTYASVKRAHDHLVDDKGIVFLGPQLSEGLNLSVRRVIDTRRMVVVHYDAERDQLCLLRTKVSGVSHVQRAARLRDGGVYFGADLTVVTRDSHLPKSSEVDRVVASWLEHLVYQTGPNELKIGDLVLNQEMYVRAQTEGVDWADYGSEGETASEVGSSVSDEVSGGELQLHLPRVGIGVHLRAREKLLVADDEFAEGARVGIGVPFSHNVHESEIQALFGDPDRAGSRMTGWSTGRIYSVIVVTLRMRNEVLEKIRRRMQKQQLPRRSQLELLLNLLRLWDCVLKEEVDLTVFPLVYARESVYRISEVLMPSSVVVRGWLKELSKSDVTVDWGAFG